MYANRKEAKKAGWHSRRHETNEAQTEARERFQGRRTASKVAAQERDRIAHEKKAAREDAETTYGDRT